MHYHVIIDDSSSAYSLNMITCDPYVYYPEGGYGRLLKSHISSFFAA